MSTTSHAHPMATEPPAPRSPGRPEMDSGSGLELPSIGRTLRLFGRAVLLRCPNCGGGPVLRHWLRLRVKCAACALRLQRGEHDAFTGSMFILFTLVALVGYAVLATTLLVADATPWTLLEYGLPPLTIALLVVCFPFSKLVWLAFDLMLRPVTREELEWHRNADAEFDTERDASR